MKSVTYKDLVAHYGLNSCDNETGCILSPSVHKRGRVTTWRGNTIHWQMGRNVTMPGLVRFLRVVSVHVLALKRPTWSDWAMNYAKTCMWAQREAKEQWKVSIPPSSFTREKGWLRGYYAELARKNELTLDMMTSPEYLWANTHEEK